MAEEYTPLVDYPDYTQEFAISAVLVDMIPVTIKAQTIDKIRIDIVAQSIGNIQVDIAAQTVGNITVDIAAQSVGNLAVDIKAATAKVAITIDAADITGNLPIDITAQTVGNITVDIAAQTISELNVKITAATATVNVNIEAQTVHLNVKTAAGEKVDTIRLPDVESAARSGATIIPDDAETSVITITGKGKIKRIAFWSEHDEVEFRFTVDGTAFSNFAILTPYRLSAHYLHDLGYGHDTPDIQLHRYNAAGECFFVSLIPFEFSSSFEIRAYQNTGLSRSVDVGIIYNKVE